MANHKSALKRARQNEVRKTRNISYKTRSKKAVKAVRAAITGNSGDQAKESLRGAISTLQKSTSKGVIHKKKTARKISRLARQVNRITSSAAESPGKG